MNIRVFKLFGTGLLMLSLVSALVIISVPLGLPQRLAFFKEGPSLQHSLFFALTLTFGTALLHLASDNLQQRSLLLRRLGWLLLSVGFLAALVIFRLHASPTDTAGGNTFIWWLFVICTPLGMIEVYLGEKTPGPDEVALVGTRNQHNHYSRRRNIVLMSDGTFDVNCPSEQVRGHWELSGKGDSRQLSLKATREMQMQIRLKGLTVPYQLCAKVGDEDAIYQKSDK